jgi:hypothetical protein
LEPKKNWNAAYKIGYRPSTFSKGEWYVYTFWI